MFLSNLIYIFLAIVIIFVESNYGETCDRSTYRCEDGYKPTYQDVREGYFCAGEYCDFLLRLHDYLYCSAAERFCAITILRRYSPVYTFNGTTGVRQCDAKERVIQAIDYVSTSCADGQVINAYKLLEFCKKLARSQKEKELISRELKRCNYVEQGKTAEEIKSKGDQFCEYVLLYCNTENTKN